MKKSITLFSYFALEGLTACKKEKNATPVNHYEIKIEHIAALESSMSGQLIETINTAGTLLLKPGDVIV